MTMKEMIVVGVILAQAVFLRADGDVAIGNKTSVKGGNASLASEAVGRGLAYREQMQADKDSGLLAARARTEFMLALIADNRNTEAYYQLGGLYRDVFGYAENALEMYESFVRLVGTFDERAKDVQRKIVPELRKRIASSAAELQGATSRDCAKCAQELAEADRCRKRHQHGNAVKHYKAAHDADVLSFEAICGLAQELAYKGSRKEALEYYLIASRLRPRSVDTLIDTGYLAYGLHEFVTAADMFSKAIAVMPQNRRAIDALVAALLKAGRVEEANVYSRLRRAVNHF